MSVPASSPAISSPEALRRLAWLRPAATQQGALGVLLLVEIIVFAAIGTHFFTRENAFEILRLSVELGLLAVALTPVIVSGGIDLSVGSMLGLSAVLFGKMWRDGHLPIGVAAAGALGIGAIGGSLNGLLITRGRIPPLIVTLGSYSLFRGLAEGIAGPNNFTHFPERFLFLGQGYLPGGIPVQLPIFILVVGAFWVLQHRMTFGRALVAIGFAPEGARYAGIKVERTLMLAYVLSGLVASLTAIIYVARAGQAKADAGTGDELLAITAVVLGGTSIFGGRGSIHGTLLGLFTLAVLKRGLRLADQPAELADILSGVLLILSIVVNQLLSKGSVRRAKRLTGGS